MKVQKRSLLGQVKKSQPTDNFFIDRETVEAPLVGDQTVVRACCTGCGKAVELLEAGANRLAKLAGTQKPEVWQAYYFEVKRCPLCGHDYQQVELKAISAL